MEEQLLTTTDLEKFYLQAKPALALLFIGSQKETYASKIFKEIDSTYAHTLKILSRMERHGLIESRPFGRITFFRLTDQGRKVQQALIDFKNALKLSEFSFLYMNGYK